MKFTHLTALVAAAMVSFLMMACGGEPPVDGTDQGIQITKQTEMDLRVVAASGEAKVTLIVHRTGLRAMESIQDADIDSPYVADFIIRNRHGFPFLTSGNHGIPVDPDEGVLSMVPEVVFYQQEQLEDLRLAIDATAELRHRQGVGGIFRWEIRSLRDMSALALENATKAPIHVAPATQETGVKSIKSLSNDALGTRAVASTYRHEVMVRKGACVICGDSGEHSAVLLNIYYNGGAYIGSVSTQNHGREASDSSMTTAYNCPKNYYGRTVAFPNFQPYASTDLRLGVYGDAGGCHTSYGVTSGTHVCNDDTKAQYNNVKYNYAGTWTFCQDSTLAWWAPYCD